MTPSCRRWRTPSWPATTSSCWVSAARPRRGSSGRWSACSTSGCPIVAHSEINDDPFHPISRFAKDLLAEAGDDLPIAWVHRSDRYGEKLATPDTSIADLIGEVDPIRVAEGRYLSDELTIHYGLVPRLNRGIFAVNELPDLAERIQVGLLNVLEERDVQIRGHRVRLPLDIVLVATANPEDYTNRGRIITPLKDRFGAQIRTHYPTGRRHRAAHRRARGRSAGPGCRRSGRHGGVAPRRRSRVHGRGGRRVQPVGPAEPPPQPALRRLGPPHHRQLRDPGGQRHPAGPAQRRVGRRPPGVGPRLPHLVHPGQGRDRDPGGGAGGGDPVPDHRRRRAPGLPPPGAPRPNPSNWSGPSPRTPSSTPATTFRRRPTPRRSNWCPPCRPRCCR